MGYIKPIKRLSATDNKGSILQLLIARKVEVVSIPDPIRGVITGDIVFAAGCGFTRWDVTLETARIKSNGKQTREGVTRSNPLTFSVPKDNAIARYQFLVAEADEFIVCFTDGNGSRKLYGTLDSPVRFTFDHDGGGRFADGNKYDCQFYYDGPDNIYFYSGNITDTPPGTESSRVEFANGDLISLLSPTDVLIVTSDYAHTFSVIPGSGSGLPALVKWSTGELIAALQPGDRLIVDSDFSFDFDIIYNP
jgi:hypothetical protein